MLSLKDGRPVHFTPAFVLTPNKGDATMTDITTQGQTWTVAAPFAQLHRYLEGSGQLDMPAKPDAIP